MKSHFVNESRLFYILLSVVFSFWFIDHFIFSYAPQSNDPILGKFSGNRAYQHYKKITENNTHRIVSTVEFNRSYQYILEQLKLIQEKSKNNNYIRFTIEEQLDSISDISSKINQYQRDVRNIIVTLLPVNGSKMNPFLISSHIDTQEYSPGSYNDCAGVVSMIELAETLVESKKKLNIPLQLLFIGSEELGMYGSTLYLKKILKFLDF